MHKNTLKVGIPSILMTSAQWCAAAILSNPLSGIGSIPDFIAKILDIAVLIITPLLVIFLVYAGFLFVTAQGNEQKVTKARNAFLWAVIGAFVALGAKIMANALAGTVASLQ